LLTVVGDFCALGSAAGVLLPAALESVVFDINLLMPIVNNVLAANAPTAPIADAAAAPIPTAAAIEVTTAAMAVKIGILCTPSMFYGLEAKA
jgi:hypothetical protein